MNSTTSYRSIFKATSLFGGVQAMQILLNLVRVKFIAVILGAVGMGLNTMFSSTISLISNLAGLRLNNSAVREISRAKETGDSVTLSKTVITLKRWLYVSSIIGFVLVILLSPLLSRLSFNSSNYTVAFIFLSLMVIFNTLSMGNASIMQGMRNLKKFALYSLTGSAVSLILSVPLYFLFGIKAIVPALVASSLITYLFSRFYVSSIKTAPVKISWKESYVSGRGMVKLGVLMLTSSSIGSMVNYLVNLYIINRGSVVDLGLYQAGTSVVSQSVGLIFTAMVVDYYPRLAAICDNKEKANEMVNQQTEIALLIAIPVLSIIMIAAPVIIRILWTREYLVIADFMRILSLAMVFKVPGYSIGFLLVAKGDKKAFFYVEALFANISLLIACVVGYRLNGLTGLAWGYIVMHVCYFLLVVTVTWRKFSFSININLWKQFLLQLLCVLAVFLFLLFLKGVAGYIIASLICLLLLLYSLKLLDEMIDIKGFLKERFSR
ncbi:MAG: oligosaccharide flippase family protein [Bacteroidales bacterium]|nr:oligosaccharide flippase family protein [Bacteroidales bacterium]